MQFATKPLGGLADAELHLRRVFLFCRHSEGKRPCEANCRHKTIGVALAVLRQLRLRAYSQQRVLLDRGEQRPQIVSTYQYNPLADLHANEVRLRTITSG